MFGDDIPHLAREMAGQSGRYAEFPAAYAESLQPYDERLPTRATRSSTE
jgi:hypothetical protein